jgi:hypothetical protein
MRASYQIAPKQCRQRRRIDLVSPDLSIRGAPDGRQLRHPGEPAIRFA